MVRERFHADILLDSPGLLHGGWTQLIEPARIASALHEQAFVLATSDAYLALGLLAVLMIPLVLRLQYIPAPQPATTSHG